MKSMPVFTSTPNSKNRLSTRSLRRRIDLYLSKAGLKKKGLSAHTMRSTSATLALEAGVGLLELQLHLGHSSPETTVRYLGRLNQMVDKASAKIDYSIK